MLKFWEIKKLGMGEKKKEAMQIIKITAPENQSVNLCLICSIN